MNEYNPRTPWDELKSCFDHTQTISLPAARHNWINLHVQDHKSMAEYNNELFRIVSQLTICKHPVGKEEQIEKMLSTLHSTNLILSTQYQNMKFTRYLELMAHMLLAEKHQLLLLQNTKSRPPGTLAPLTNSESHYNVPHNDMRLPQRGRGNRWGRGMLLGRGYRPQRGGRISPYGGRGRGRGGYGRSKNPWMRGTGNQQQKNTPDQNKTR